MGPPTLSRVSFPEAPSGSEGKEKKLPADFGGKTWASNHFEMCSAHAALLNKGLPSIVTL